MADVVPDRLGTQVELGGDLLRRAALLQETEYLRLARSEMRVRCCGRVVGASSMSPKTPTTRSPFTNRTALTSTGTRVPVIETRWPVASLVGEVPSIFSANRSRARRASSGATTEV